jgi:hypothetical protein
MQGVALNINELGITATFGMMAVLLVLFIMAMARVAPK